MIQSTKFCSCTSNTTTELRLKPNRFIDDLRERILSFLCSGEDMNSLNMPTQFSILKANVSEALMLVQVWGFNVQNKEEELDFVFSDRDQEQFKVEITNLYENIKSTYFRLNFLGMKE